MVSNLSGIQTRSICGAEICIGIIAIHVGRGTRMIVVLGR